jgi:hypothetical protein
MSEAAATVQPIQGTDKSIGRVISVSGSQAIVLLEDANRGARGGPLRPVMGTLMRVKTPSSMVLGLVSAQSVPVPTPGSADSEVRILELELVGELSLSEQGEVLSFQRGVSRHPALGDEVFATSSRDLEMAYSPADNTIKVGAISQDPNIPARVLVDDLLGKHSAVLGTTGTGKSCATPNTPSPSATGPRSSISPISTCPTGCSPSRRSPRWSSATRSTRRTRSTSWPN